MPCDLLPPLIAPQSLGWVELHNLVLLQANQPVFVYYAAWETSHKNNTCCSVHVVVHHLCRISTFRTSAWEVLGISVHVCWMSIQVVLVKQMRLFMSLKRALVPFFFSFFFWLTGNNSKICLSPSLSQYVSVSPAESSSSAECTRELTALQPGRCLIRKIL